MTVSTPRNRSVISASVASSRLIGWNVAPAGTCSGVRTSVSRKSWRPSSPGMAKVAMCPAAPVMSTFMMTPRWSGLPVRGVIMKVMVELDAARVRGARGRHLGVEVFLKLAVRQQRAQGHREPGLCTEQLAVTGQQGLQTLCCVDVAQDRELVTGGGHRDRVDAELAR